MLLNLSNHPSSTWSEKQRQKAVEQFGEIKDIDFPAIDPEGDEKYIARLVEEFLSIILNIYKDTPSLTVHLMGEFTFCFSLLQHLKAHDIPCVASTTRRIVNMNNNIKLAEFEFVRFRYY